MAATVAGELAAVPLDASLPPEVEVEFSGPEGKVRREPLRSCWDVRFERVAPVRTFLSFRGQRNWPGLWWFARTGEHVGFESWVERDRLMAFDANPWIAGIAAQPMWLHWIDAESGRSVRHAPDYFARRADGTGVVVDVRPDERVRAQDAAVFAATARFCAQVGWQYLRLGELGPVWAANLHWLAGYRHPRNARPTVMARLRDTFATPTALLAGAAAAGDRTATLPVLFGMLWRRELTASLETDRLNPSTPVSLGASAERGSAERPASGTAG